MQLFKVKQDASFVLAQAFNVARSYDRTEPLPIDLLLALVMTHTDRTYEAPGTKGIFGNHRLNLESVRPSMKHGQTTLDEQAALNDPDGAAPATYTSIVQQAIADALGENGSLATTKHLAIALIRANDTLVAEVLHLHHVNPGGLLADLRSSMLKKN